MCCRCRCKRLQKICNIHACTHTLTHTRTRARAHTHTHTHTHPSTNPYWQPHTHTNTHTHQHTRVRKARARVRGRMHTAAVQDGCSVDHAEAIHTRIPWRRAAATPRPWPTSVAAAAWTVHMRDARQGFPRARSARPCRLKTVAAHINAVRPVEFARAVEARIIASTQATGVYIQPTICDSVAPNTHRVVATAHATDVGRSQERHRLALRDHVFSVDCPHKLQAIPITLCIVNVEVLCSIKVEYSSTRACRQGLLLDRYIVETLEIHRHTPATPIRGCELNWNARPRANIGRHLERRATICGLSKRGGSRHDEHQDSCSTSWAPRGMGRRLHINRT